MLPGPDFSLSIMRTSSSVLVLFIDGIFPNSEMEVIALNSLTVPCSSIVKELSLLLDNLNKSPF